MSALRKHEDKNTESLSGERNQGEESAKEAAAMRWLSSYNPKNAELTAEQDREGRAAIADMLFEGKVSREVMWTLAALIAPDNSSIAADERRLDFASRKRGKPSDDARRQAIAKTIYEGRRSSGKLETGLQKAMEEFEIEVRYARKCWDEFAGKGYPGMWDAMADAETQ